MTLKQAQEQAANDLGFKPYIASWAYREWMAKAAELYAKSKWEEACDRQYTNCLRALPEEAPQKHYEAIKNASKPEFKP